MTEEKAIEVNVERAGIPIGAFVNGPRYRIGTEDRVLKPYPLKKVIILGMGMSLWDFIHSSYGNPSHLGEEGTEIWSINYAGFVFQSSLVFNMHDFEDPTHREVMSAYSKIPATKVVSIRSYDWLSNTYEYPLQEVLEDGMCGVPYIRNTTSYALAFAILCRVPNVEIYGCDFDYDQTLVSTGDHFERGRANLEFWIGKAIAHGINVYVAPSGTLMGAIDVAKSGTIEFYGYGKYKSVWDVPPGSVSPKWVGFDQGANFADVASAIDGKKDEPG